MSRARTIADFGDGIVDADLPAGSVLQVVSATTQTPVTTSSNTFIDTGLTANITPSSASSKILIFVAQNGCHKNNLSSANMLDIQLIRGATNLGQFAGALAQTSSGEDNNVSTGFCFVDSPSTTSSVTYKTMFNSRNNTSSVSVQYAGVSTSSIVLMEIADD